MPSEDRVHVFICVNQKKPDKKCCAGSGAEAAFEYLKEQLELKRDLIQDERRIKVVKTSCLGRCKAGPNIYIVPDNLWYTFSSTQDLDELIETHFIKGEKVTRLLNQP